MIFQGKARYPVREVILHCAAVATGYFKGQSPLQIFTTINRWHRERGFRSFGYHGLITPEGVFYPGRPFDQIGAHVAGHNLGTLGFLLIESREVESIGDFADWFTPEQAQALRAKLATIPGIEKVSGHNDYAAKMCPGFYVKSDDWL